MLEGHKKETDRQMEAQKKVSSMSREAKRKAPQESSARTQSARVSHIEEWVLSPEDNRMLLKAFNWGNNITRYTLFRRYIWLLDWKGAWSKGETRGSYCCYSGRDTMAWARVVQAKWKDVDGVHHNWQQLGITGRGGWEWVTSGG